jgi:hypothetical protein
VLPAAHQRRLASLLFLALCCAAQLYLQAHQAFVPHHLCPVDGELAHASHVATDHGAEDVGPALSSPSEDDEHEEHCSLLLGGVQRKVALRSASIGIPPAPRLVRDDVVRSAPRHAAVAVLAYAPKQSPPLVG